VTPDRGRDHEHRGTEAVRGRDPQGLARPSVGTVVGHQDQQRETNRCARRGAGRGDAGGDTLLAVVYSGARRDEHRREDHAVTDAHQDQARD
jgi:hypothetical protein